MGIDATVCIPWRPTAERMPAYNRVRDFWNYHGFKVIEHDSGGRTSDPPSARPFNLSQARNNAVRKAITRYVIVADADTLPDIGAVMASLDEFDGVTWPFTEYRHIPGWCADKADLMSAPADRVYNASVGGIFICQRERYWKLGGCDELFTGWGFEDNAFHAVADTLSHVRRMPGIVFSFNHFHGDPRHDEYRDMSKENPNRSRYELYRVCSKRPHLMRELIRR
jgi:hypothetical protein